MEANNRKRLLLLALLLVFMAPLALSWWLLNYTEFGQEDAAASHGILIVPPRPLGNTALFNPAAPEEQDSLHGKWSLLYLHEGECLDDCVGRLYKMRQLRLASGEYAPRIQRILAVAGENRNPLGEDLLEHFSGQLLWLLDEDEQQRLLRQLRLSEGDEPKREARLYLIDPLGNLMMSYSPDAEPAGIIKDLKRLLRYSRIG